MGMMALLADLRSRVAALVFWRRRTRELREELDHYLAMEAAQNEARGLPVDEARRLAHIKLGGVDRTVAEVRDATGVALVQDVGLDVMHALRGFSRQPVYWASLCLTLSIGLALTTLVFVFADAYLMRPLPYPDGSRLVAMYDVPVPGVRSAASLSEVLRWGRDLRQLNPVAGYLATSASWFDGSLTHRPHVMMASRGYFTLLGIPLVAGHDFADDDRVDGAPPVAIVSEAFWHTHLNSTTSVVGSSIILDGRSFTIVGVAVAGRDIADEATDVWLPLEPNAPWRSPQAHYLSVVGHLAPGAALPAAVAELQSRARAGGSDSAVFARADLVPLRAALAGDASRPLMLLLAAGVCVLLVSLSNAAGLVHARGEARRADLAMRRALGASGGRLMRQAACEFLLVGGAGAVGSALIAAAGIRYVESIWVRRYHNVLEAGVGGRTALFLGGLVIVATVIMALPVAWRVWNPETLLGVAGRRVVGPRRRLWVTLVVAQVALTTVLLIGSGLSWRSLQRVLDVDPGYDARGVYTAQVVLPRDNYPTSLAQLNALESILTRLRSTPGVAAAGGAVNLPLSGGTMTSTFGIDDDTRTADDREHTMAEQHIITPGYLDAMRLKVIAGRDFTAADRSGAERVVLVNESMARRYWPNQNVLGHRLRILGSSFQTIVGVLADTRLDGLDRPSRLETYTPFAQEPTYYLSAVVRIPGGLQQAQNLIAAAQRSLDPHIPVQTASPITDLLDRSTQGRRIPAASFGLFAAVALILAAVGIFGLLAFVVTQRRAEIGVRIALGATGSSILGLIGRSGLRVVTVGLGIGLALSAAAGRVAASYVFGISAYDVVTYGSTVIVVLAAGATAVAIPAIRAAGVDPVTALQSD
jgi:predicted permease